MRIMFAGREVVAVVVEDRGRVGMAGRHLLRVRIDMSGADDPIELEIPSEDVRLAAA